MIGYDEAKLLETAEVKASLLSDLILFTQTFYKLRYNRDFVLGNPIGRENHYSIIAKALYRLYYKQTFNMILNCPPRMGKTTMLINFVAWSLANYPDCNFLYVSYSYDLACLATAEIKSIIETPYYRNMFDVRLKSDSKAKDSFMTTAGGSVVAVGTGGSITGRAAGIFNCDRFGGILIADDLHKAAEASSQTIRESVKNWWSNTLQSRRNDAERTGICLIGQRVHEDDIVGHLSQQKDRWEIIKLPAIDAAGNSICPQLMTVEELKSLRDLEPFTFEAQYQQEPTGESASLFKVENFPILEKAPNIIATFITVDTAETDKTYNDATVFSLWGIYRLENFGVATEMYAIHWINCIEIFVQPRDLKAEFLQFYGAACSFMVPSFAAIEKKSTGVTLVSVLEEIQGLNVVAIDRTAKSGSKIDRHISMQRYISQKLISLPYGASHTKMCIDHMIKINAAGSQRRSDIADTVYDACRMVFIDKTAIYMISNTNNTRIDAQNIMRKQLQTTTHRLNSW